MNTKLDVATFMRAGGQQVETHNAGFYPARIDQIHLYAELIREEYTELVSALASQDIVETADACVDLIWVIEGLMYSAGIDPQSVWEEVARSNHSKIVHGNLIKREDGKVLKPESFTPPNIRRALGL